MEIEILPECARGPFFTSAELSTLKINPQHIAIIPDGNRRWATDRGLPLITGYLTGAQALIKTALAAKELSINVLTIYSFSTENWKRPKEETDLLIDLIDTHLRYYCQSLIETNIRLHVIGNIATLPSSLQKTIEEVCSSTASATGLDLVIPLNYGGRDEIVRAFKRLMDKHRTGTLDDISEEAISQVLDTHKWPDPDLIIRTSGEQRLSNFLLWQSSYAESYTETMQWPDFSPHHLLQALAAYQNRARRKGGS